MPRQQDDETTPRVQLHHGTDEDSANDILANGIDAAKARMYNVSGEFWATVRHEDAEVFARVNLAGGPPVCFEFELPVDLLRKLIKQSHAFETQGNYEFLPKSFPSVNKQMANRRIVVIS